MAIPAWFDAKAYFNNKLVQMNESIEVAGFDGALGKMDSLALKAAFEAAGYTTDAEGLYQHFLDFGNNEGISPSSLFNAQEYLYGKALGYYNATAATPQMVEAMAWAMLNINMSAWDHYDKFWAENYATDGTFHNPSARFDVAQYMQDKLAQLQADEPDAGWTMDGLVQAFQNAGLSPIEHYYEFGAAEGLTVKPVGDGTLGNTYQLTSGTDTLVGTTGDDYFHADNGDLNSTDLIDGGAGTDTLYAIVEDGHDTVVNPRVYNVENVLIQVENTADGGTGDNLTQAWLDADRISLAAGETLTIGSVNSRGSLTIEDIRHNSNDTIIRFADPDPGSVSLSVYFDPQHLSAGNQQTTGKLYAQLIDTVGAFEDKSPLRDNPYTGFKFTLNGEPYELDFGAYNHDTDATPTYAELVVQMQAAIDADSKLSGLGLTVELGGSFDAIVGIGPDKGEAVTGTEIVISSDQGKLLGGNWVAANGLPSTNSTSAAFGSDSVSDCPLISTTVELDNVGRVQWNESAECLPDHTIYGSTAGDVVIGSMADRGGVERLDLEVDGGSWLASLSSTNQTLRMVTVQAKDIDGDGTAGGSLYIGKWEGWSFGDLKGDNGILAWTDAADWLTTYRPGLFEPNARYGLIDVAVFDATDYAGDINIATRITEASFDKYFKWVDGERYIDKMFAPLASDKYAGAFSYFTGDGNDTISMRINEDILADNDFKMNIDTGAGDDRVQLGSDLGTPQNAIQKNLQNVTINTGDGNDIVLIQDEDIGGAGYVINTGSGNDVIYSGQRSVEFGKLDPDDTIESAERHNALFVFNTSVPQIGIDGLTGATLNNDLGIGASSFAITGTEPGVTLNVVVTFKGIAAEASVAVMDSDTGFVSAETVNHAIINAIVNDPVLSNLLVPRDGAGHSLIIESLINGKMATGDLAIMFEFLNPDETQGKGIIDAADEWYQTQFGRNEGDNAIAVYSGTSQTTSQAVVNAGTGNDLIVLGPNGILKDVVELDGSFGNDTIVGFTRYDRINLAGILEAGKSLITDAGADALRDNAVVVVTDAVAADAENGIFTATEVQTLITEGKLGFSAAAASGATGVVFLQDTNAEHSNVYTVVQLTKGSTVSCSILGSITLDQSNGVAQTITEANFTLESVLQDSVYGNTYDGDYYQTTEDTTITGTVLCDTFNDLSDATLGKITTVAGNNGDDVFNITGDLGTAINGDAGNDIFNVNTRATVTSINGGDGTDTLHVTDGSNVTFRAVENIVLNHDANPQEAIHLTIDGTTEVTDIKGFDGALGDRLKIASGDANVTLTGSAAVELAGSSSYLELTDVNDLTLKDFTTTAPVEFDFRYSWDGFTFGNLKIDGSLATHALTFKGCLGSDIAKGGTFIGGKGNDAFIVGTLYSGDTVTGGEGNDTFNVQNSTASSFSTIEDFTTGEDKIICGATALDTSRFNTPLEGPFPTAAFKTLTGTTSGTAYLVQYNDVTCLVVTQGTEYVETDVVVKLVGVEPDGITLDDLQ